MIYASVNTTPSSAFQAPATNDRGSAKAEEASAPLALPTFWIPTAGSGWIDFNRVDSGHIIIPVILNGEPVRAMIDTGVDQLMISKSFADAHGLPLTPWTRPLSVGGPTQYYSTPNVSLTVGALRTSKPGAFLVTDLAGLSNSNTEIGRFDVIIGLSLLVVFEWQVDQDMHRFRFLPTGTIPTAGGTPIRMGPNNSRLVADIEINGRRVTPAMIDTGSDEEVSLPMPVAHQVGFQGQTDIAATGMGGMTIQPTGRLSALKVGNDVLVGTYATVGEDDWFARGGINALLGMGVLQKFNMTVDRPAGMMVLGARTTTAPPIEKSKSGIQGWYNDGRETIVHVMRNSPAAIAGLKHGDAICGVNGKPMSQQLYDSRLSLAPAGTRYVFSLCDGTEKRITLRVFY